MLNSLLLLLQAAAASAATTFITLGDWGGMALGSYKAVTVAAVAKQMAATATDAGISFVVNTGDNFYYCGITSTSDPQIVTDFTGPYGKYASLNVPWYGSLGNHEYGYDVDAQIKLASESLAPKWVLDARYYTRRVAIGDGNYVSFIFLDTSPCVSAYRDSDPSGWDPCGSEFPTCAPDTQGPCEFHKNILTQSCSTQFDWFQQQLASVPAGDWLIVVGHHPADEIDVADFNGAMASHGFDLYLNGHVHTLQQYAVNGNSAYVTSGAGALLHTPDQATSTAQRKLAGRNVTNQLTGHASSIVWTQKVPGFTLHTFSDDYTTLKTDFVTYAGETVHSFTTTKGAPPSPTPPSPSGSLCQTLGCGNHDASCWCTDQCEHFGDCCTDYKQACGGGGETCDVHAWPCANGCTYVHSDHESACGVTAYGCYDCAKLAPGCPDCSSATRVVEDDHDHRR